MKRVKTVSFPGGSEITMALLGGHVDVISTGPRQHVRAFARGQDAHARDHRPAPHVAPFADVPTWKEVGVDTVASSWRGVMGPKDLTPAQVAYWEDVFRRVVRPKSGSRISGKLSGSATISAAETRRRLDAEYAEIKQIMSDLGMAKVK